MVTRPRRCNLICPDGSLRALGCEIALGIPLRRTDEPERPLCLDHIGWDRRPVRRVKLVLIFSGRTPPALEPLPSLPATLFGAPQKQRALPLAGRYANWLWPTGLRSSDDPLCIFRTDLAGHRRTMSSREIAVAWRARHASGRWATIAPRQKPLDRRCYRHVVTGLQLTGNALVGQACRWARSTADAPLCRAGRRCGSIEDAAGGGRESGLCHDERFFATCLPLAPAH